MEITLVEDHPQHHILNEAYRSAYTNVDTSQTERKLDGLVDHITAGQESLTFQFLNSFYEANQSTINAAATSIISLAANDKAIGNAINSFAESAKVIMKGLDALGQVHPFIGVAVVAFKLVVTLDMTRRENNKKVLAIKLQMQDMICVLFQLRRMKDPEEPGPDGVTLKDRFQGLIEKIADDIRECGSACDVYMKKGFLARTIKSKIYEARLAAYGALFSEHRVKLEGALAVHTALGVDLANEKLDKQDERLKAIDQKIVMLFRKLDSPREKEVQKFIEDNGGARMCIEKDELLEKLASKAGESLGSLSGYGSGRRDVQDALPSAKKALLRELSEDVEEVMKKNMALFVGKLDIQNKQLTDVIRLEGQNILNVIQSGAHERVKDDHLQQMWKEMGWKSTVKARHFVLALRDYFSDLFTENYYAGSLTPVIQITFPHSPPPTTGVEKSQPLKMLEFARNDEWTLSYINIAHLQPILEAIDDDGSGFINVREANMFARDRPQGWSLLQWLAYWAAGWHMSISKYRTKIYYLVQKMHNTLDHVLPDNRRMVDEYLDHWAFDRLDLLLRGTLPIPEDFHADPELSRITDEYTQVEEERLLNNLNGVGFDIDTTATAALVAGPGRIERYIYPIIYLELNRHMDKIRLSCHHILHADEFSSSGDSLMTLFVAIDERIQSIEATYRQMHLDVKEQLENFAFGMFHLSYGVIDSDPFNNALTSWENENEDEADEADPVDDNGKPVIDGISLDILECGTQDSFVYHDKEFEINILTEGSPESLQGTWTGHCFEKYGDLDIAYEGLIQFTINSIDGREFEGRGEEFNGLISVNGEMDPGDEEYEYKVELSMTYNDSDYFRKCIGVYNEKTGVLTGEWSDSRDDGEDEDEDEDEDGSKIEDDDDDDQEATESDEEIVNQGVSVQQEVDDQEDVEDQEEEGGDNDVNSSVSDSDEEGSETDGTPVRHFYFCRTPVDFNRFRYASKAFEENRARARWGFAARALRYQVQRQMWSSSYFKQKIVERKRWIELSTRETIMNNDFSPHEKLSIDEVIELRALRRDVSPSVARLYEALKEYSLSRMITFPNYPCDACNRDMLGVRLVCVNCRDETLRDGIDLCLACIDKPIKRDLFEHNLSHSLIRSEHFLHIAQTKFIVTEGQSMSERLKEAFKALEGTAGSNYSKSRGLRRSAMLCTCCRKAVTTPCWVCVICASDTFVCMDCDAMRLPALEDGPSPDHDRSDIMLRLYDSAEVEEYNEEQTRFVKHLRVLRDEVDSRLLTVERKVDERLAILEHMVENQFGLLHGLLKKLAGMKVK